MSFLLYDVAMNPEVQERLVEEIKENELKLGEKFDYKSVQNMTYMDMVVSGKRFKFIYLRICMFYIFLVHFLRT